MTPAAACTGLDPHRLTSRMAREEALDIAVRYCLGCLMRAECASAAGEGSDGVFGGRWYVRGNPYDPLFDAGPAVREVTGPLCVDCEDRPPLAKGRCRRCYERARRAGKRRKRYDADTYEAWLPLKAAGMTFGEAAAELGMTAAALSRAVYRVRASMRKQAGEAA
jgi:hypothetical protein